jgi:hypothetical protein
MALPTVWAEVVASKAIIMGLKRYSFRREYCAARLGAAGFTNLELVDSFDGFQMDADVALKELGYCFQPSLRQGHKGNCYTMLSNIKKMVDDDVPYRTFFEDDALGHLDLPNGLGQKFWDATPKDFDILYLGNMMNSGAPELAEPNALVVQLPTYCLHAFMLSRKGALHLLHLASLATEADPLQMWDVQLVQWQLQKKINWQCWNGTHIQKSFPTFDEGLPWQFFQDIITPEKDTGLFWQNMRVGTTLGHPTLQLTIPQYSI